MALAPVADAAPLPRFEVIMWQPQSAAQYEALRHLGISAGKITGLREKPPTQENFAASLSPLIDSGAPFYVENIATDFYAPYHRWMPGHQVTWLFDQAHAALQHDPTGISAFVRQPSLSDSAWQARIEERLRAHVAALGRYRPLYYNLGDETGIADLAAAWDFDLSHDSLAAMRVWLRGQYGSLAALNAEWGSSFAAWDDVQPMRTDAALARTDGNFAAWGDFKAWMDVAFARAVQAGTDALHAADPAALAGLEGAQVPGWGGYDYSLLAPTVDVMEVYDADGALDAARSFNPGLIALTTSFGSGPAEVHQVWQEFLHGTRGLVLWDEGGGFLDAADNPGPRARDLAPVFAGLCGGIGTQILAAAPRYDAVAIFYSQASFRMQWLLDRKADGKPWTERNSEIEGEAPNGWRDGVRQAVQMLDHAGVQPSFVSDDMAAGGALRLRGVRMLILPDAIALSPQAAKAIAAFAAGGGVVLADKEAGLFDLHGRRQAKSLLAGAALTRVADFSSGAVAAGLREAHVSPGFALADAGTGAEFTDVEARRFQTGKVTILALLRDFSAGRAALQAENGVLSVGSDRHIYVLGQGPAGSDVSLKVTLSSTVPAIFVISPTALPGPVLRVPQSVTRGSGSKVAVALTAPSPAADDAVEVTIADPAGRMVGDGPETILLHDGEGAWTMRIGKNGPVGVWTLRAKEMLGGQTTTEHVRVN